MKKAILMTRIWMCDVELFFLDLLSKAIKRIMKKGEGYDSKKQ